MALPEGTVPVTVYMDRKYVERIDRWSEKLGHSRSKLAALIIESAIDTDGWALEALTSRPGLFVLDAIRMIAKGEREANPLTGPPQLSSDSSGAVPAA